MKPTIIKSKDSYTLSWKGKDKIVVNKTNTHKIAKINKLIAAEDWTGLENFLIPAKGLKEFTKGKMKLEKGHIFIGKDSVPEVIGKRILELKKAKQDWKHLVLFWNNLKKNPSKDSKEQLFLFLDANHFAFTSDGRFIGYKKVTRVGENLMDSHSKTLINNIGTKVSMPRDKVNPNRDETCSTGLHVGAWEYVDSFTGDVVVEVIVNPKDVVAVPNDYNNQKMRVCEYLVYRETTRERPNTDLVVTIITKTKTKPKKKKKVIK